MIHKKRFYIILVSCILLAIFANKGNQGLKFTTYGFPFVFMIDVGPNEGKINVPFLAYDFLLWAAFIAVVLYVFASRKHKANGTINDSATMGEHVSHNRID